MRKDLLNEKYKVKEENKISTDSANDSRKRRLRLIPHVDRSKVIKKNRKKRMEDVRGSEEGCDRVQSVPTGLCDLQYKYFLLCSLFNVINVQ